ncbi:MAG: hypothetical protein ACYCXP_00410 [Leptospirillum sp.]
MTGTPGDGRQPSPDGADIPSLLEGLPTLLKIFLAMDGSLTRLLALTVGGPVMARMISGEEGERRVFLGTNRYPELVLASSCPAPGGDLAKTWEILSDPRPIGTAFVERGEPMIRENLLVQKREGTLISPDPWKGQSLWMRSYVLSNMAGVRISIKEIFLPQLMDFLR